MYICKVLDNDVCVEWVSAQTLLTLPEGSGAAIGLSLLGVAAVAFCVRIMARLLF